MLCNSSCKRNVVKESFKNSTFYLCTFCDILWNNCLANTNNDIKIFRREKNIIILIRKKCILAGNWLENGDFAFLFSVYIFNFIVCGKQKKNIYKEMRSP